MCHWFVMLIRNMNSSYLNSWRPCTIKPHDSQRTSVCSSKFLCSAPISRHIFSNKRRLSCLALIKLTILIHVEKTLEISSFMFFAAKASQWIMQLFNKILGFTCFILATKLIYKLSSQQHHPCICLKFVSRIVHFLWNIY